MDEREKMDWQAYKLEKARWDERVKQLNTWPKESLVRQVGLLRAQAGLGDVVIGLHPSQMPYGDLIGEILRMEFPNLMTAAPDPEPEPQTEACGHLATPHLFAVVVDIGAPPEDTVFADWLSEEPELRGEQLDVVEQLWKVYVSAYGAGYRFHTERALIALGWPGRAAAYAVRAMHERAYVREGGQ